MRFWVFIFGLTFSWQAPATDWKQWLAGDHPVDVFQQAEVTFSRALRFVSGHECPGCLNAIDEAETFLMLRSDLSRENQILGITYLVLERLEVELLFVARPEQAIFASAYGRFLHQFLLMWLPMQFEGALYRDVSPFMQRLLNTELDIIKSAVILGMRVDETDIDWLMSIANDPKQRRLHTMLAGKVLQKLGRAARVQLAKALWQSSTRREQPRLLYMFRQALVEDRKVSRFNQQFISWLIGHEDRRLNAIALQFMHMPDLEHDDDLVMRFFKAVQDRPEVLYKAMGSRLCHSDLNEIFPHIWLWTPEEVKSQFLEVLWQDEACRKVSLIEQAMHSKLYCERYLTEYGRK